MGCTWYIFDRKHKSSINKDVDKCWALNFLRISENNKTYIGHIDLLTGIERILKQGQPDYLLIAKIKNKFSSRTSKNVNQQNLTRININVDMIRIRTKMIRIHIPASKACLS